MIAHKKHPHARAIWGGDVGNAGLVQIVTTTANAVKDRVPWPLVLPAEDAARIAWQYVRQRTRYDADKGTQYVLTPWAFVRSGVGDCKTTAVFIATLARAAGHRAALRFIAHPGRDHFGHVFAVVDGVPVDPLLPYGAALLSSHQLTVPL